MIPLSDEDSDEENDPFWPTYEELFNGEPESLVLHLPLTLSYDKCVQLKLHRYVKNEISLQEGQANDALHGLHHGTGEKSFKYQEDLCHTKGNIQTTQARSGIQSVSQVLNHYRHIYGFAWCALISLSTASKKDS
jgi:hypothetical protein